MYKTKIGQYLKKGKNKLIPSRIKKYIISHRLISNVFHTKFTQNALLVYVTTPFTDGISRSHQNQWSVYKLAQILHEMGYNVDAVDFKTVRTKYKKIYDLVIDISPSPKPLYQEALGKDCIRIAYLTGSNPSWANIRENERIKAVNESRQSGIVPRRQADLIDNEIQNYSAVLFIGNTYNLKTYSEFDLPPVYLVNNYGLEFKIDRKKFNPKSYCYIASTGQVHKGLHLLLEIFSTTCTDCELFIFSDLKKERDFCETYRYELTECENIHVVGFLDVTSDKFLSLIRHCTFMILPSCSEGQSGSVCTAMGVGLIPIVSRECGFEDNEVEILADCTLRTITNAVIHYSQKKQQWLTERSERSYYLIQTKYNQEIQTKQTRNAIKNIIG